MMSSLLTSAAGGESGWYRGVGGRCPCDSEPDPSSSELLMSDDDIMKPKACMGGGYRYRHSDGAHPLAWFALEAASNVRIRQDQVDVAMHLMAASAATARVTQLDMGRGKTSVIMPMLALALSDGRGSLARLQVPDAVLQDNFTILYFTPKEFESMSNIQFSTWNLSLRMNTTQFLIFSANQKQSTILLKKDPFLYKHSSATSLQETTTSKQLPSLTPDQQ